MPTRILALLLLLLALVAAGCGGDDESSSGGGGGGEALSKDDYIAEINKAQTGFVDAVGGLNLASPESPDAFADSIEKLGGNIDTLVADLEEVNPPEEIADLHQQLVDGMEQYGTSLADNLDGLRGDQGEVQAAAQEITKASTDFSQDFSDIVTQINEKLGAEG